MWSVKDRKETKDRTNYGYRSKQLVREQQQNVRVYGNKERVDKPLKVTLNYVSRLKRTRSRRPLSESREIYEYQ